MKIKAVPFFANKISKWAFSVLTAALVLLPHSFLFAGENAALHRFGLQECIDYALKNQAGLQNQQLAENVSRKNLDVAYGRYLPQITAGATYQHNIKRQISVFGGNTIQIGTVHQLSARVDADQAIFDPTLIGTIANNRLQFKMAQENTRLTKIDLVVQIRKTYYGVLVAREQMTLLAANITRSQKELSDTKYQYQNGLAQQVDIDRIQVLVNNAVTQKGNARRTLKTQVQSLKYYMGMPVNDSLDVTGSISEALLSPDTTAPDSAFYKNRVEYMLAEAGLQQSRLLKRNITLGYLPSLSAFASYVAPYYGNSFEAMFDIPYHPTVYVGLQLSLPIFTGLTRFRQGQIAGLNQQISRNNILDLRNNILLEFNRNYRLVKNDTDNLTTQKQNIALAKKNYANLKYQYDNGLQPIINVLDAETTLIQAQNNYINALYQLLVDQTDLEKSLGRINY